jgi:hypothetical protein
MSAVEVLIKYNIDLCIYNVAGAENNVVDALSRFDNN